MELWTGKKIAKTAHAGCGQEPKWKIPVHTFQVLPKRWIVERTFGWLSNYRRLAKEYEYHPANSEALILVA